MGTDAVRWEQHQEGSEPHANPQQDNATRRCPLSRAVAGEAVQPKQAGAEQGLTAPHSGQVGVQQGGQEVRSPQSHFWVPSCHHHLEPVQKKRTLCLARQS